MSYFVTFYSYKGGVGRTLALANVAWLLANHKSEPARILAVDFDLGAPGLSQVFGSKHASKCPGIVDYVTEYLTKAAIPDLAKFIQTTPHKNIDLLPAGRLDSTYQRRLEMIDWKALYEGAFGYELIERLKADISAISPEYDYVLIDSLTGYSDVGGICVNQFPDTLILLFRLNQQNLDGISTVYRALQPRKDELSRSVIPVITPSWPFLDEAAGVWIKKAEHIFSGINLLEISFDSSLSFGERIISAVATDLPFASKVISDYKGLAVQIRQKNSSDPLTLWEKIRSRDPSALADPAELYLRLLLRRPNTPEYWLGIQMAFGFPWARSNYRSQGLNKLMEFVDQQADAGNKYALVARARTHSLRAKGKNNWEAESQEDLNRALKIDPEFFEALFDRGRLLYHLNKFEDAIENYNTCLKFHSGEEARVEYSLAQAYLNLFMGQEALQAIEAAIAHDLQNEDIYELRARALYLLGDYSTALSDARKAGIRSFYLFHDSLLPSQILAAMGQIDDAAKELAGLLDREGQHSIGNVAEAYLAVDPQMTIKLLSTKRRGTAPSVRKLLIVLARILLGNDIAAIEKEIETIAEKKISRDDWGLFETVALLRAKQRAGAITPKALELARRAIFMAIKTEDLPKELRWN